MFIFRFILFLVLIYLIVSSIGKFIFGTSRGKFINGRGFDSANHRREGDISIKMDVKQKKKISKDAGEYVNFEEIKKK
jgi:hypothetical protein